MTNVSSGSKRPWDGGHEQSSHKRSRDDARDWRDVHLRSPRRPSPHRRRDSRDRGGRNRDFDRHRSADYGRDRDRDRRDDRDRDRGRRDDYREERTRSRDISSHQERTMSRKHTPTSPTNNVKPSEPSRHISVVNEDSEKEEGE